MAADDPIWRRRVSWSSAPAAFYFGIADGAKAPISAWLPASFDARSNCARRAQAFAFSAYDAMGAAQVAKSSFTGMRLLHRLDGTTADLAVGSSADDGWCWSRFTRDLPRMPQASRPAPRSASRGALDFALNRLGSPPHRPLVNLYDHLTDAFVSAAGCARWRERAARFWNPADLTRSSPHRRLDVRHL